MPTTNRQLHPNLLVDVEEPTVSKWIDGYQHMANVRLRPRSALPSTYRSNRTPAQRTYISAFSNRFFRFSFIASFDILLMSVRSETPTSFFLVLSKAAFRTWGFPPPLLAACALLVSFLRPARFVTACQNSISVYSQRWPSRRAIFIPWRLSLGFTI